jgi:hypothetical protein
VGDPRGRKRSVRSCGCALPSFQANLFFVSFVSFCWSSESFRINAALRLRTRDPHQLGVYAASTFDTAELAISFVSKASANSVQQGFAAWSI